MISVVIIGSGNVARHLIKAFLKIENVNLKQVYTRNSEDEALLKSSVSTTSDLVINKRSRCNNYSCKR